MNEIFKAGVASEVLSRAFEPEYYGEVLQYILTRKTDEEIRKSYEEGSLDKMVNRAIGDLRFHGLRIPRQTLWRKIQQGSDARNIDIIREILLGQSRDLRGGLIGKIITERGDRVEDYHYLCTFELEARCTNCNATPFGDPIASIYAPTVKHNRGFFYSSFRFPDMDELVDGTIVCPTCHDQAHVTIEKSADVINVFRHTGTIPKRDILQIVFEELADRIIDGSFRTYKGRSKIDMVLGSRFQNTVLRGGQFAIRDYFHDLVMRSNFTYYRRKSDAIWDFFSHYLTYDINKYNRRGFTHFGNRRNKALLKELSQIIHGTEIEGVPLCYYIGPLARFRIGLKPYYGLFPKMHGILTGSYDERLSDRYRFRATFLHESDVNVFDNVLRMKHPGFDLLDREDYYRDTKPYNAIHYNFLLEPTGMTGEIQSTTFLDEMESYMKSDQRHQLHKARKFQQCQEYPHIHALVEAVFKPLT